MSTEGGTKAIIAAFLANTGIAITKFIAFLFTQSSAMLAESVHSVADAGNQLLLIVGGRRAQRQSTPEHPFGYGRERYIFAFIVAIVLFSLGGLFAIYEGYHKITHPEPLERAWIAMVVLGIAIVLESFSLRTAVVESNKVRAKRSWTEFVRTAKAPELPVVLLEDIGALLGLFLALVGIVIAVLTGDAFWDGVGSICIGVLLVVIAIVLAIETKSLLLGEGATRDDVTKIEAALTSTPQVQRIIHMKTLHLGPEELLVAAKIAVSGGATGSDVAQTIDDAETRIREAVPIARVIYLEPDIDRAVQVPEPSA
jgi:cation diffusion facilitator family transporter